MKISKELRDRAKEVLGIEMPKQVDLHYFIQEVVPAAISINGFIESCEIYHIDGTRISHDGQFFLQCPVNRSVVELTQDVIIRCQSIR